MEADYGRILLAHGGGSSLSGRLVRDVLLPAFDDPFSGDSTARPWSSRRDGVALTTDAFVVSALFFPGGDIGALAVAGTIKTLALAGAVLDSACAFVLEEGLPVAHLRRIIASMAATAAEAGVRLVAADRRWSNRQGRRRLYATAGVGVLRELPEGSGRPSPGDVLFVDGPVVVTVSPFWPAGRASV